ncbi:hypothetical protein TSAR_004441 [Trichomalopsis sarcophagae]|uniref:Uncharacterized protein n=1 Tax=Trichomalopsis sarcophagae TaxID=543379 RepID=A0A232EI77_9HYME|nr:hypothetical protein TSAR_004441 [Trichomalopsis sarcophagae]
MYARKVTKSASSLSASVSGRALHASRCKVTSHRGRKAACGALVYKYFCWKS